MNYDVIIIGAGVIGGMVARELSRFDLKICLLERRNDVATGASKANSGIVHGGFDPEPDTLKAKLNVEGVPLLYKAAEELHVPCKNNGSIVCAFGKKEEEALKELYDRGIANGVLEMKLLSGDEAREIEPNLSKDITKVLQVPTAGIICPYDLTIAAIGNAMDNGADLKLNFNVTKIDKTENGFTVYSEKGESVGGKYVIKSAMSTYVMTLKGDGTYSGNKLRMNSQSKYTTSYFQLETVEKLDAIQFTGVTQTAYNKVNLKWKVASDCSGYMIYKMNFDTGKFQRIKKINDAYVS